MNSKTIVSAMDTAHLKIISDIVCRRPGHRHARQYHAFRARILKMDADKNKWIKELLEISTQERLLNEVVEKDKRIVELETENDQLVVLCEELVKKKDKIIVELENKTHKLSPIFLERDQYGRLIND